MNGYNLPPIDIAKVFGAQYLTGNHLFICQWGQGHFMALIEGQVMRHGGPNDLAVAQFARMFGKPNSVHRFASPEDAHKAFPMIYRDPNDNKERSAPTKKC